MVRHFRVEVDPEDQDLLNEHEWSILEGRHTYYARRSKRIRGKSTIVYLHRVILERKLGRKLHVKEKTDHKDQNGLNNHRDNLRLASGAQNCANSKSFSTNKTGYRGVSRSGKRYRAVIYKDNKQIHLGRFLSAEDAARMYDLKAKEFFGEFATLNFT